MEVVTDSEGSSRISLEPHEVHMSSPTKGVSSVSTVIVPPTRSFLSHMSKDQHVITKVPNTDHSDFEADHTHKTNETTETQSDSARKNLPLPQATPPLLSSITEWRPPTAITSSEEIAASGWGTGGTRGLTAMGSVGVGHGHMITKRPRGRPKGSGTKDKGSTGNIIHSSGTEPCDMYTTCCTCTCTFIL